MNSRDTLHHSRDKLEKDWGRGRGWRHELVVPVGDAETGVGLDEAGELGSSNGPPAGLLLGLPTSVFARRAGREVEGEVDLGGAAAKASKGSPMSSSRASSSSAVSARSRSFFAPSSSSSSSSAS